MLTLSRSRFAKTAALMVTGSALAALGWLSAAQATSAGIDASTLFDWAENTYPTLFPKGPVNQQLTAGGKTYTLRYYAAPGNYLGVGSDQHVYALGAFTNQAIQDFGLLSDFTCQVRPDQCAGPQLPPGGLYLGYYAEDAASNPEDPTMGAFTLNLPAGDGAYAGSMFFTYVGCQSSNVGTVSGNKSGQALAGQWGGTLDGQAEGGDYSAQYSASVGGYAGSYSVAAGKHARNLLPCIQYIVAAKGAFEMFPMGANAPASFSVALTGRTISWGGVSGNAYVLAYVIDPALAQTSANPVLWQTYASALSSQQILPATVQLESGKEYVVAVSLASSDNRRLAFGSRRFVAP